MKDNKERIVTSTNGVGTLGHHCVKQNKESRSIPQNTIKLKFKRIKLLGENFHDLELNKMFLYITPKV